MNDDIIFSREKALGIITLNRPKALNALTFSMILAMQKQLEIWQKEADIHAVVIHSNSDKAFCAGGDIRMVYEAGAQQYAKKLEFFWHEYRLNHFIHNFGKPYIALMDGVTMGGGVGIALHGSHPVASERFSFAMPETGIGFFPDIGSSYLLNRCPENSGRYLGLTGNRLTPFEAKNAGLVKSIVSSSSMPDLLLNLINTDLSTDAHRRVDACLTAYALAENDAQPIHPLINQCFSKDSIELIKQALEQSPDALALELNNILAKKSPLSLKVTLEQLNTTKGKSLASCLKIDYTLVQHFIMGHDFYEGVRALLIDKDKNPQWDPPSLALVDDKTIIKYFEQQAELSLLAID